MPRRFTRTVLFITGGLLIWLANFVFVYVFAAVACARGFADVQLAGVRLVVLVVTVSNLLAGAASVALLVIAGKRRRTERGNREAGFIHFLARATGAIALLALLLLALPPLLVEGCSRFSVMPIEE